VFVVCSDGPFLRKLEGKDSYQGIQLSKEKIFQFARQAVVEEVIQAVSKRFSDFCQDTNIVGATKIADLKAWPHEWESLKGTSSTNVFVLFCFYSTNQFLLNKSSFIIEFCLLYYYMYYLPYFCYIIFYSELKFCCSIQFN
jgi:hypothetical protein